MKHLLTYHAVTYKHNNGNTKKNKRYENEMKTKQNKILEKKIK